MNWLLVFVGGGLGSLARFALTRVMPTRVDELPWATIASNVLACVIMGAFLVWLAGRTGPEWRLFVMTGICGGFSTFSTFSLETLQLARTGHFGLAVVNVGVNLALCLAVLFVLSRRTDG